MVHATPILSVVLHATNTHTNIDILYFLGMLSKSMGQILRVSVALHILFRVEREDPLQDPLSDTISQDAIKAAINFVEVCCQHTAYISGRGKIENELELMQAGDDSVCETTKEPQQESTEALILGLPGESLDVSYWVHKKRRFRHRGGIEGALKAMKNLQENGMGKLEQKKGKGSVKVSLFIHLISHYVH